MVLQQQAETRVDGTVESDNAPEGTSAYARRKAAIEEHLHWMKQNSPGWETADPYAMDWQAIKAEGRRY